MTARAKVVAPLLFGSGFCALLYQMAWLREFRLVFGASTAASAAVVAIFVGGLGAGGLLIAVSAAVTPALLWLVRRSYVALGGTVALGLTGGTLVRLVLAALVLLVPTWLMGGTLPAAARAVSTSDDPGRRGVALLYGVNTLGAVCGSFLGTFFMLEAFGTRRTLWLACLLNLLVAILARQLARTLPTEDVAPPAAAPADGAGAAPTGFVLAAAAIVGFAFFLMELVWYRMLGPILGGSIFTFGLILSVALLGIGLGGAAYSLLRQGQPATLMGFARTCLLEALAIAIPYALGDRIAVLAWLLRPLGSVGLFWGQVLGWTMVCTLVVLPASLVAGYQFPVLIGLLGHGRKAVGRHVGLAYAWNTLGAIAGSLAGGFGLLPWLSAPGAWKATGLLLAVLGLAAAALSVWSSRRYRGVLLPAALVLGSVWSLGAPGPSPAWRHGGVGVGRAPSLGSPNAVQDWQRFHRRVLQWEADGVESSVAVEALGPGLAFVINGKVDGNSRGDAATMIMSGLVGALLHPDPRRSLVIGLGTGGTAGWLAAVPSMERTDVVELEPLVLRVARDCAPINQDVMQSAKVRVTLGDARETLLASRESYDVVFSEPSNPYRAGIASLFTREYYEAVAKRMREGGLFLQWVQAYDIDSPTVRTIYATLASVFPEIDTWQVNRADLLLVASAKPIRYDVAQLRQRLAQEPFRSGVRYAWRASDVEGFLGFFVGGSSLAKLIAASERGEWNSDDRNLVEFGFARTVGRRDLFSVGQLREAARLRGEDRPSITGGDLDWARFDDDRALFALREDPNSLLRTELTPEQQQLMAALHHYDAREWAPALAAWRSLKREPRNPVELTMVAELLANTGDESALGYIDQVRGLESTEADALLAQLRWRQGRIPETVALLESTLGACHSDPWPHPPLVRTALDLVGELVNRDPQLAVRLYALVKTPFVLHGQEDERLAVLGELLAHTEPRAFCREVFASLEPNVPWTRPWLTERQRCYASLGDPRLPVASAELRQWLREEPTRFAAGLAAPVSGR